MNLKRFNFSLMCVLQELFSGRVADFPEVSETLIKQFTFWSELFSFPPLPSENNRAYFMLRLGLQLCIYPVLIEHKQECLKIAAPDHGCPLHSICMFILPARGPLFMDNWGTQIIIPLRWKIGFYYLQSFAMSLCTLTPPSDCLFIITAFLLGQWESGQVQKGAKPFPALFLSVTSLCIPLKHTDPCLVCSLGGTHHTQTRV